MALLDRIETRWVEAKALGRMALHAPRIRPGAPWNPARLLALRAAKNPQAPAVVYLERRYSWRDVDMRVNSTARALREIGIEPGEVPPMLAW